MSGSSAFPHFDAIHAAAAAAADAPADATASTTARGGPYCGKGKSMGKGKGDKGKGLSKVGADDTEQCPSREEQLERRIYDLEGEFAELQRQVRWMLSTLDRVLPLHEEPSRH